MTKITKRAVDRLIGARSPCVIRDDDVKGFGARLNGDGSVSYLVEYRAGRGRGFPVRRIVLGKHGLLTSDQARILAKKMLARVLAGDDPAAERANRRRMTVGDLLHQTLITHWRVKSKPSTIKNASTINHSLIPEFGARRGAGGLGPHGATWPTSPHIPRRSHGSRRSAASAARRCIERSVAHISQNS
jgi:Arm DNA-binding domain